MTGRFRLADRILRLGVRNADERDMILGDLEEEAQRRGRGWHLRAAAGIAAHAMTRRFTASRPPQPSGDSLMKTWIKDVRYGWRSLRKRPLITLTVAATLALGLGANAAIFNIIDRLILHPYPLRNPDRAVLLAETAPDLIFKKENVSPANFYDWRRQVRTMAFLSAYAWWDANLVDREQPERLHGDLVTATFFDALDARPALGRAFVRDDESFGRHHVAIISDALWHRRFDADRAIIGRRVILDGEPTEVIGVMPPRFSFPEGCEIWAPLAFDPKTAPPRDRRYLTAIGRLEPGRTLADAQAEMSVLAANLARDYPETNRDHGVRAYTLTAGMLDEGTGPMLSMFQASALVVLLIACANIANLLLARAAERRRETALRLALGASRLRVMRELLVESALLALVAIPPALAVAWASLHVMQGAMPANIIRFVPGWETLGPDWRLVTFTIVLALATSCMFGLLPAVQAARSPVAETLKEGGRTSTGRQILRRAIVVAQLSIALPLLVAACLGLRGSYKFLNGPQGYDPDGLVTLKIVLPERAYPDGAAERQFTTRALDAVNAVPGVQRAAAANVLPAAGGNTSTAVEIEGHAAADKTPLPEVDNRVVSHDYFSVLRIAMLRGRGFTAADREGASPVAIVSDSMAKKYWPGADPIGQRVRRPNGPWLTIVGVSGDVIQDWFMSRNAPTLYRPMAQWPTSNINMAVRTAADPAAVAGAVRQALLRVDASQPLFDMMTMRQSLHERTIGLQFLAAIMSVFAALALLLAAVGLYAVIAYLVAQRRHEIGLRMALGASRVDITRMTVGQALRLALLGTGIGLVLSIALGRAIEAAMVGVAHGGVTVFAGLSAALVLVAVIAGYLPARRAAAIDPMTALRAE